VPSRRTADENAPQAPLEKARFNEVLQQYPADLPVETGQLRGVGGGELCARVQEQSPDTHERFLDTSRLEWLCHVCRSSRLRTILGIRQTGPNAVKTRGGQLRRFHRASPRRVVPVI